MSATLVSLVDTAMVGSLGAVATAAVGVCASPSWLVNGLVYSVGVGGTALVARLVGAGDRRGAEYAARQVYRAVIFFSLAAALFMYLMAPVIPRMMQASGDVIPEAAAYMRIYSMGLLINYVGTAMSALLRGAGDTRTPMRAGLLANALNCAGNFLLIYEPRTIALGPVALPMWGAGMGVRGAALASALSISASGAYVLYRMHKKDSALYLRYPKGEKVDSAILGRVVRVSVPAAMERLAVNVGQILFAAMITSVGTAEVAAYHIAINVEGIGYMPAFGFAAAATALVGQRLGAGDPNGAERLGRRTVMMSLALLILLGLVMWGLSGPLASLFSPSPAVVALAAAFIAICAAEQPFNALSIVLSGALRGAGDTLWPFLCGLISMWGVRILGAYIFGFVLGFGVMAVFWAMVADLGVRSLLLWVRFSRGRWKTKTV